MEKLTNKDKMLIRQAMFNQIENLIYSMEDKNGYNQELSHIKPIQVRSYAEKLIGLYSLKKA